MGIVRIDAESVIGDIVEAMLPRFSDENLGLIVSLDMRLSDYGYGDDGNTRERPEKNVSTYLHFIFTRPANYTQVYFWQTPQGNKGLSIHPKHNGELVWTKICDHDSCWRDSTGSELTDAYFAMSKKFNGRMRSGKELRPCDLSEFVHFLYDTPRYVKLVKKEPANPDAERFSRDSLATIISFTELTLADVEGVRKSTDFVVMKIKEIA